MKSLRKVIYIALIFTVIGTSFLYANDNSVNDCLFIKDMKIEQENEFIKVSIKYPVLSIKDNCKNDTYRDNIERINKDISNTITNFSDRIKKEAIEYKENNKKGKYKYKYEAYVDYDIGYNKNNIISIPITMYEFTGGAHGFTTLKPFNYNLKTGEPIKLKDMFKDDVDYKDIINKHINKEIDKNKDIYFQGEDGFKGISDNQTFYIDNDGIVVYFGLYDIAPYSTGIPKFKLTWDEIGKYLNKSIM
ncbi:copper amine oxidase domain-containing protein [[Clostridium] sordellii]|uniref:DUF3298 and DUF4163 domain-containing protein n=1 Tax=Paraclostridium sordellii TaxID=1505 RepID=UPI0005E55D84|nr:DUF3298 and DUF4163 domain-containing protein [Paeniclostridium sordellii]CEO35673.1 copper amine oxidase domain-containing protein [[Clostridium] sordellii] [Paeniclostridium sordellii]CEP92666.1 copper amine oxidase domain-containing protein [[Clostridium] sordellii] [Paeniclostridium sordellii]